MLLYSTKEGGNAARQGVVTIGQFLEIEDIWRKSESTEVLRTGVQSHPLAAWFNLKLCPKQRSSSSSTHRKFPDQGYPLDVGIDEVTRDDSVKVLKRSAASKAQCGLWFFMQRHEGSDCQLKYKVTGDKNVVLGEDCIAYSHFRIFCKGDTTQRRSGKKCTYHCTYQYKKCKIPNERNLSEPIFKLVGSNYSHTCDMKGCAYSFKGTKGSRFFSKANVEQMNGLLRLRVPVGLAVRAAGFDRENALFVSIAKRTYNSVYSQKSQKLLEESYSKIHSFVAESLRSGQMAFASMQGLDGSKDMKPRLIVQLTNQRLLEMLGWAPIVSIDFLYKLFDEKSKEELSWSSSDVAVGHITTIREWKATPIWYFLIESENKEAVDWIKRRIDRSQMYRWVRFTSFSSRQIDCLLTPLPGKSIVC